MYITPTSGTSRVSSAAPAMPTAAPAGPAAAPSPAHAADVATTFAHAFRRLGATVVTTPSADTLILHVPDADRAGIAAGVLRDRVDGVRVQVQHPGGTARPAGGYRELANAAEDLPQLYNRSFHTDRDGNGTVSLWAQTPQLRDLASRLVRSSFDGTPVDVVYVKPDLGW